jgi:hypothetical protein
MFAHMEHNWKHYITHSRMLASLSKFSFLYWYKKNTVDIWKLLKLRWDVRQQENWRIPVVDVEQLNLSKETLDALNKPHTFIFDILMTDLKSTIRMSKRGDLPSIFLKCRNLEVYHRKLARLDAHLFLQSQLVLHTHKKRFCPVMQNPFFDFILYLTENTMFIKEYKGKSWP